MWNKFKKTLLGQPQSEPSSPPAASIPQPIKKQRVSLEEIARSPTHPVLSGADLLDLLPRWPEIENRIFRSSKVTREQFDRLYLRPIVAFAERVQFLPASQSNHHAGPLGQLEHTLEVIEAALALRSSKRLPLGAEPERVSNEALIWTYATFVGALGHDAGRPIARFIVKAKVRGTWHNVSMWGESLYSIGATEYAFSWLEGIDYGYHNRLAPLMLGRLLPAAGCAWLNQCPQALSELSAWLYGDQYNCGVIGEICREADGASVARNVGGALPGATVSESGIKMPIYKRAEMILRDLAKEWVVNGRTTSNAVKAGGSDAWVVGSYVFARSNVMNDLYSAMASQNVKGMPESPPGIMTKLSDAGSALSYEDSSGTGRRKSVFTVRVQTADGHTVCDGFTVVVFPVDHIFPLKNRPPQFDGTVTVLSPQLPAEHVLAQHTRKPVSPAQVDVTAKPGANAPSPAPGPVTSTEPPPQAPPPPPPAPAEPVAPSPAAQPVSLPEGEAYQSDAVKDAVNFLKQAAALADDSSDDDEPDTDASLEGNTQSVGAMSASDEDFSATPDVPNDTPEPVVPTATDADQVPSITPTQSVGATTAVEAPQQPSQPPGEDRWKPLNKHGDYMKSAQADSDPLVIRAFFAWLRECMGKQPGSQDEPGIFVGINARTALVHGVEELPGCLGLVSPKAFREFITHRGYKFAEGEHTYPDGSDAFGNDLTDETDLQNILRESRWAVFNGMTPGQNVFTYRVRKDPDKDASALNLIILSADATPLILPEGMRPDPNPLLKRVEPKVIAEEKAKKKAERQAQANAPRQMGNDPAFVYGKGNDAPKHHKPKRPGHSNGKRQEQEKPPAQQVKKDRDSGCMDILNSVSTRK